MWQVWWNVKCTVMEAAAITINAEVVGIVFEVKTYLKPIVRKGEDFHTVTIVFSSVKSLLLKFLSTFFLSNFCNLLFPSCCQSSSWVFVFYFQAENLLVGFSPHSLLRCVCAIIVCYLLTYFPRYTFQFWLFPCLCLQNLPLRVLTLCPWFLPMFRSIC